MTPPGWERPHGVHVGLVLPGYVATSWYGVGAPAGTPEPILARLEAAIPGLKVTR